MDHRIPSSPFPPFPSALPFPFLSLSFPFPSIRLPFRPQVVFLLFVETPSRKLSQGDAMDVWQGVVMDSLKYYEGPPCRMVLSPAGGPPLKRPYARFRGAVGLRPFCTLLDTPRCTLVGDDLLFPLKGGEWGMERIVTRPKSFACGFHSEVVKHLILLQLNDPTGQSGHGAPHGAIELVFNSLKVVLVRKVQIRAEP
jgi:hypothetical protein